MKKAALFILMVLATMNIYAKGKKDIVIRKSEGSITFVVDENLPAPEKHLWKAEGKRVSVSILNEFGYSIRERDSAYYKLCNAIVATSFDDAKLNAPAYARTFFSMLMTAYAEHRPIAISPDDVWLLISQGVAHHINQNAETLRDKLVSHQGKIELVVETNQPILGKDDVLVNPDDIKPVDWTKIFDGFVAKMKENTKGDIVDRMCADFSTTTVDSRIASQITLMNALQPYFNYTMMRLACGNPYITLKGTPSDWQKILDRVRTLDEYGLDWWTAKLCPVLEEFVKTAQGNPDHQFWRCMMTKIAPDKIRGGACSPASPTKFDGWFLAFFPYDQKGRTPSSVTQMHSMLKDIVYVDFKYRVTDELGNLLKETPMQFYSGFVGIEEDEETYELKSKIGWMVCY